MSKIDVLNSGYIELVRFMGSDEAIIEGARECFQTEGNALADQRLLEMLVKEKHSSPLEHCTFNFKVKMPRFIEQQWTRHRIGCSYSIRSFRYTDADNADFFVPNELSVEDKLIWLEDQNSLLYLSKEWYGRMVNGYGMSPKRARELSNRSLPTTLYTTMRFTCNGASLMHFLDLRYTDHAQPEIKEYAKGLLYLAKQVAPITFGYKEKLIKGEI